MSVSKRSRAKTQERRSATAMRPTAESAESAAGIPPQPRWLLTGLMLFLLSLLGLCVLLIIVAGSN